MEAQLVLTELWPFELVRLGQFGSILICTIGYGICVSLISRSFERTVFKLFADAVDIINLCL